MGCLTENSTSLHLHYDSTVFVFLTALQAAFIPWIVGFSILLVASVTFVKKLQSPQNYIILSIAIVDFFIGVAAIPMYLAEDINKIDTRKFLRCHLTFWRVLIFSRNFIQITAGYFLTLLCIDSFIQLNYPVAYKNHCSVKYTKIAVLILTLLNFTLTGVFFGIVVESGNSFIEYKNGVIFHVEGKYFVAYLKYILIITGSACIVFSIQVRVMAIRHESRKMTKITAWLSMSFIILYIPTVLVVFLDAFLGDHFDLVNQIGRIFRFGVPLTNGYIIYLTRPAYQITFKYFLRTNPRKWKNLQCRRRITIARPIDSGSAFSTGTKTSRLSLSDLEIVDTLQYRDLYTALVHIASSSGVVKSPTESIDYPGNVVKSPLSAIKSPPGAIKSPTKLVKKYSSESNSSSIWHPSTQR